MLLLVLLSGCPASPPAPMDRPAVPVPDAADMYRVQRGDTLYSIAFRHHVDWRDLARWNDIGPPHTIYPGQQLRLRSAEVGAVPRTPGDAPDLPPVAVLERPDVGETRDLPSPLDWEEDRAPAEPESDAPIEQPSETTESPPVAVTEPEPRPEPAPEVAPETRASPPDQAQAPPAPERSVAGVNWRWPAEGRMVRRFDASASRKGIGIAGDEGQPVVATADGHVVYSGTGLLGYGELIIVKHTDNLLSAYGYNRRRLVDEGERIRAGQTIAEMGRNERNEVMLHFEIRNNGQPADPLRYLPQR